MATTIFFNGRLISRSGSYTEVDDSALEQVGLGASGIVAVLGTAEGGRPVSDISAIEDIIRLNKPEAVKQTFRSGDLLEAGPIAFKPANDADILAGAQQMVAMKVNPATKSASVLGNAQGDALDLSSLDYGAFTSQINVSVGTGTNKGKLLTIIFEDFIESEDDLGGDDFFTLKYTKPTNGWDAITGQVIAGGSVVADATRAVAGLDTDIGTTLAAPGAIEVLSSAGGDTTQTVHVYGLDGTGAVLRESLVLTGTAPVVGTLVFAAGDVLGVRIEGTTVGSVSVRPSGGGSDVFTVAPGASPVAGGVRGAAMYVSGSKLTGVVDAAATPDVIVEGTNASGSVIREKFVMTGVTPLVGLADFSTVTFVVLGDTAVARTITWSAEAAKADVLVQNNLQKASDYYNARFDAVAAGGFVFTVITGLTTFSLVNLDEMVAAVSILDPAEPGFKADLWAILDWINQNSVLISAAFSSGASGGAPDNTTSPVFLVGGIEGVVTNSEWQNALNLLKQIRVNTIVPLTGDPAIHAMVEAHNAYMGGIGRSERDGLAGALNAGLTDVPSKTEYKSQAVDLNSRHMRLCGQAIERFNDAGERQEFLPPFAALVGAGMQAGSPVGTSLTSKYADVLAFRQHSSWNPTDDAEEMIQAGLFFLENVEGQGRRWVRNVTTHLTSNNIARTEASVNEAVNFAVFNFRTNMEFVVGKPGFAGTISAAKGVAINTLQLLVDTLVLVLYRSLDLELIVDVMEIGVEIAPVIPINFVKSTIHLVTVRQSA